MEWAGGKWCLKKRPRRKRSRNLMFIWNSRTPSVRHHLPLTECTWTLGVPVPKLVKLLQGIGTFPWFVWGKKKRAKMKWGRRGREQQARQRKKRERKPRDWQNSLYWTGVPLPWQPAALDWYLEQQVELLQRIWCSVHIWGRLIWRYTPLHFQSLVWDTVAGTRATGGKISRWVPD